MHVLQKILHLNLNPNPGTVNLNPHLYFLASKSQGFEVNKVVKYPNTWLRRPNRNSHYIRTFEVWLYVLNSILPKCFLLFRLHVSLLTLCYEPWHFNKSWVSNVNSRELLFSISPFCLAFYQILQVHKFTFFPGRIFCIEKAPEGERYKSNNLHVGIKVRPHDIPKDCFFQDVKHLQLEIALNRPKLKQVLCAGIGRCIPDSIPGVHTKWRFGRAVCSIRNLFIWP